jgi:catechol 2,3-dioxygenase-like lactoylglutathione lyase family enzyme
MRHLAEITCFTGHFEESVNFYRKLLDSEPVTQSEGMAIFLTGAVKLMVHTTYPPQSGELPPTDHVAIAVRDLDMTIKSVSETGILPEVDAKDYDWGRSAYYRDPDGRQVELHQGSVDWSNAHDYFSAHCYNSAWDLIDKNERTPDEDIEMISRAHASLWHWNQRPDCTDTNRSIGYWQLSRVYALANQPENARQYGQLCLKFSSKEEPVFRGFAFEALARAEMVAGNIPKMAEYLSLAREYAGRVPDLEDRQILENDLDKIMIEPTG